MDKVGIRVFLVFVFLSLFILLLDSRGDLVFIRNASSFAIKPVGFLTSGISDSISESFSFLTFWKSGEVRIKNLEQRNLELQVKALRADDLERENKALRSQLGVKTLVNYKMLPARVLGLGRFLIIGVGESQGVKTGQTVVYKNDLVGIVSRATSQIAYVKLPTDTNSKIPVRVEASETIKGLLFGQFNSSIIIDQVVQTDKLSENQSVFTTGEDEKIVPGLLVGRVGKITSKETDLFKKAEVKQVFNYGKLDTVFVILN